MNRLICVSAISVVASMMLLLACGENEETKAAKELAAKITQLDQSPVVELDIRQAVLEFRNRDFSAREAYEKGKKGVRVSWTVRIRGVERYDEGIRGATVEYVLVSSTPVNALENTFVDILMPANEAAAFREGQVASITGIIKYITLGGDGHVVLFPAKASAARQ